MEILIQYFNLQEHVKYKNAEIRILSNLRPEKVDELQRELNSLLHDVEIIKAELSKIVEGANDIRSKFINLFSKYYEELETFKGKPYFPDLNQRLIIEKFLLSDIVSKMRFILTTKGSTIHPRLLPSDKKWNTEPLVDFLGKNIEELTISHFDNLNDALASYIKIEQELFDEVWPATIFIQEDA